MRAKAIVFVLFAAAMLALPFFVDLSVARTAIVARLQAFGGWGLVLLSASYVIACVLMLPGSILTIGAGALAAVLWPGQALTALAFGVAAVSIGSVCGATAAFLLGRGLFRDAIAARLKDNQRFDALDRAIGANGLKMTFLVRLSPAFPFNLLNYGLGLTRVSLRDYVLASWIGMLPGTVMYVYIGIFFGLTASAEAGGPGRTLLLGVGLAATAALVIYVTVLAKRALNDAIGPAE